MKIFIRILFLITLLGCSRTPEPEKYVGNWEMFNAEKKGGKLFSIYRISGEYFVKMDSIPVKILFDENEKKFIAVGVKPSLEFIYTSFVDDETITIVQSGNILGKYSKLGH